MKIDKVNPGAWFASKFAELLGAEKVMVQKSGYFARSAPANQQDLDLIKEMTDFAVDSALRGEPGVIGHDEERGDELRAIEFERIKGGKPFDIHAGVVRLDARRDQPAPGQAGNRPLILTAPGWKAQPDGFDFRPRTAAENR